MYSFDENALIGELAGLSNRARMAFAAAAATRQLSNYERLAHDAEAVNGRRVREIAGLLWTDLAGTAFDRGAWSSRLEEVMTLLPEESDEWEVGHALADDALSSLAYAIRCLLSPEPQEAAWAARRAYEAADQAAIRILGVQPGLPGAEAAIKSHGVVQRELGRQRDDLSLLRVDAVDEVERQALANALLTEQEAAALM